MAKNLYQGDPRIFLSKEGSYLNFKGGQPIMDAGFENYILILLFTRRRSRINKKSWIGNLIFLNKKNHLGNDFEEGFDQPITISSLADIKNRGEKALQPLIDSNLAREIIITVTNPIGYRIDVNILIKPPGLPEIELLLIKNGVNWIIQRDDPAHMRFS